MPGIRAIHGRLFAGLPARKGAEVMTGVTIVNGVGGKG